MEIASRRLIVTCVLGMVVGCGPAMGVLTPSDSSDDGGSTSGSAGPTPTTGLPTPATSGSTSVGDTTDAVLDTGVVDEGYEEDDGGTGCTFTCPPPPPPSTTTGGGGGCSLIEPGGCPDGEKCMPWANDGGEDWNSVRCSSIAENPGQHGDPCTVEGSGYSGIDDCALGNMCFHVDPETNMGTCVSFCGGGVDVGCGIDQECEIHPGQLGLPLCVDPCDPTAPECPPGHGCFPNGSSFTCQPTADLRVAVGMPCQGPGQCVSGGLCAFVGVDCDQVPGDGCCASVCDTADPGSCPMPQVCSPWFGGAGPLEWAHVGYCAS